MGYLLLSLVRVDSHYLDQMAVQNKILVLPQELHDLLTLPIIEGKDGNPSWIFAIQHQVIDKSHQEFGFWFVETG